MVSANQRGLIIFGIIVVFVGIFCGAVPFAWLPGAGMAMSLPVIQVPGEIYFADWPSKDFVFTNTLAGTLLADALVLLIALLAFRASKGWRNEVPGRFQGIIESFVGFVYGLVKQMAGTGEKVRNTLFPLVASIFFFLLIANWLELVPGVDSIGLMHCAHPGMNGYGRNGTTLYNDAALFSGYTVTTEEQYEMCHAALEGHMHVYEAANVENIQADLAAATDAEEQHFQQLRLEAAEHAEAVEAALAAEGLSEEERTTLEGELALAQTQIRYPGAMFAISDEQIEAGVQPYAFIVTPFIRAAATDLNLTLGLALVSFVAIQYFGLSALGMGYLQKFVNVGALGNLSKRPLGAIDFLVGLFEIVSEFSKVISLAFRLFGNIFAGQLLLFIMAFLVATMLPVIFYGLEFIVGFIQALVFAVLTLVFSAQAMEDHSHHAEDEH